MKIPEQWAKESLAILELRGSINVLNTADASKFLEQMFRQAISESNKQMIKEIAELRSFRVRNGI